MMGRMTSHGNCCIGRAGDTRIHQDLQLYRYLLMCTACVSSRSHG
jgi:hypothetical protein